MSPPKWKSRYESVTQVTSAVEASANGDYGIVSVEGGAAPWGSSKRRGESYRRRTGFPRSWKGARHTATRRGRENGSIDRAPRPQRKHRGRGGRSETKETEDVTWGPRDSQVLPKYEEIKGSPLKGIGM